MDTLSLAVFVFHRWQPSLWGSTENGLQPCRALCHRKLCPFVGHRVQCPQAQPSAGIKHRRQLPHMGRGQVVTIVERRTWVCSRMAGRAPTNKIWWSRTSHFRSCAGVAVRKIQKKLPPYNTFHKMCSYFRVYISSPSYHWWWSGFHGDTRYSWSGAWVHVLIQYLGSDRQQGRGVRWWQQCGGWQVCSTSGDRGLLLSRADVESRPFCKGPCLVFLNTGRTKKARVYSGFKMILFSFLDWGPTQQCIISMHEVTVYFYSQVMRLDSLVNNSHHCEEQFCHNQVPLPFSDAPTAQSYAVHVLAIIQQRPCSSCLLPACPQAAHDTLVE